MSARNVCKITSTRDAGSTREAKDDPAGLGAVESFEVPVLVGDPLIEAVCDAAAMDDEAVWSASAIIARSALMVSYCISAGAKRGVASDSNLRQIISNIDRQTACKDASLLIHSRTSGRTLRVTYRIP